MIGKLQRVALWVSEMADAMPYGSAAETMATGVENDVDDVLAALSTPAPVAPDGCRFVRVSDVMVAELRSGSAPVTIQVVDRQGGELELLCARVPAPVAAPSADLVAKREEVECPECHETCGWCSWYRKNARGAGCGSGSRNKCAWGENARGVPCKTCDGSGRVMATTTYEPIRGAR